MQPMLFPTYADMGTRSKISPPTARLLGDVLRRFSKNDYSQRAPYSDSSSSGSPTTAASSSPMSHVASASLACYDGGGGVAGSAVEWRLDSGCSSTRCLEPAGDLFDDESSDDGIFFGEVQQAPQLTAGMPSGMPSGVHPGGFLGRGGAQVRTAPFATGPTGGGAQRPPTRGGGAPPDARTTIMLQRIASNLDEASVSAILDRKGLAGTFTAVYVPRNRKKDTNLAYAFVDFALPEHAEICMRVCEGSPFGDTTRICSAAYSKSQGKAVVAGRMTTELTKRQTAMHSKPEPESASWETAWVCRLPPGLSFSGLMSF